MNYILYFVIALISMLLLASFSKTSSFSSNILSEKQSKALTKLSAPFPDNTELSIAIIENGEVRFLGVKIIAKQIIEVENQNKVYEIGSLTKVFTATLLADFVNDSTLKLNSSVKNYIQSKTLLNEDITFMTLANHTSGLPRMPSNFDIKNPNFNISWKEYGNKELLEYLQMDIEQNFSPSIKHEYSNLGMGLLGYVLEQISGRKYEDLLRERILERHNMSATTTKLEKIKSEIIIGKDKKGQPTPNWEFGVLVGAGGLFSNVSDLAKFAIAQFNKNNPTLTLTHKPTFTINKNMEIGLGWYCVNANNDRKLLWHNGGTSGYTSSMFLDLENQNGVIVLSNLSAFHKKMGNIDKICFGIMESLKNI